MAATHARLRLGVVGLGRLWEARHKPALARMADRIKVVAVYDHVARRAEVEAGQLGCAAAPGPTALADRPDVDAVSILAPQWFGLHAALLAADRGKPIYCALPLAGDPGAVAALAAAAESAGSGFIFVPELARRSYPITLRLRELLANALGPPRLVLGHSRLFGFDRYGQPGPGTQIAPAPLAVDPGSYLLDWCRFVFGAEPTALTGFGGRALAPASATPSDDGRDVEGFHAEFPGGAMAQMTVTRFHRGAWGDASRYLPAPGIQVFADRGVAWLEMPDRIRWSESSGAPRDEHLPIEPGVGETLNDQFLRLVRGEPSTAPTWSDALAVAQLVEALRHSQREGPRVETVRPRD